LNGVAEESGDADAKAEALRHAPPDDATVPAGSGMWWQCFNDLQSDRPVGMDVGAIPWSSIDQWARRYAIPDDEFPVLAHVIRRLDAEWLSMRAEKDSE
jgi:hypothetical protein